MNIEIMIEFLKGTKYIPANYAWLGKHDEIIDEIIKRLRMWGDFKKRGFNEQFIKLNDDCTMSEFKIDTYMDSFEEKYLSKSTEDKFLEEFSKTIDRVKEVISKAGFTCKEVAERLTPKD